MMLFYSHKSCPYTDCILNVSSKVQYENTYRIVLLCLLGGGGGGCFRQILFFDLIEL